MRFGLFRSIWGGLSLRRINVILVVVITLICGAVANAFVASWRSDDQRASLEATNIAAAITQDIVRNVELFDLSIRGAAEDMINPTVLSAPKDIRQLILFDRAASASYLGQIIVIGPTGNLVATSATADPRPMYYGDRDYFRIHAQMPNFGLYVSQPLFARSNGERVIVFSRRITNPDGSFGGVVAGTLEIDYLHQLFRQMKLGPHGSLTLFRNDGTIVMREPFDPALIGMRRPPPILFERASLSAEGEYSSNSVIDDVRRLYHFRRVGKLPLITSVGLATGDIHNEWWRRTLVIGSVVAVSCVLIVGLNLRLTRELRSRVSAEAALTALVDKDGLTGLANRRCFDRALEAAWTRAAEQRTALAMLMVDADYFKAFNDRLGHAAGDAALRSIATGLAANAGRPDDIASRYGGEEFALILPGLGQSDALAVAESIRRAVIEFDLPHPASPHGRLTVSIGCASVNPREGGTIAEFCAIADAALYRAKRLGRNTVCNASSAEGLRLAS